MLATKPQKVEVCETGGRGGGTKGLRGLCLPLTERKTLSARCVPWTELDRRLVDAVASPSAVQIQTFGLFIPGSSAAPRSTKCFNPFLSLTSG